MHIDPDDLCHVAVQAGADDQDVSLQHEVTRMPFCDMALRLLTRKGRSGKLPA